MRIAVLASGSGSNLLTMLKHAQTGRLGADVVLVLSNNPEAGALKHAKDYNVPVWARAHAGTSREDFDRAMVAAIRESGAEAVILAGYMRLLCDFFIDEFSGRILNIHPAILPSFAGVSGGRDALDYRVAITGCTVHFVEKEMDSGPVIIQAAVPVGSGDDLESLMPRIHAMEHRIYPQAVKWLAQGRIRRDGRKVSILPKPGSGPETGQTSCGENEFGSWLVSPGLEDF